MGRILGLIWAVTGVIALVVGAVPDLIVLGFFLLIVPGMILMAMPTVFLYVSVFAGVWFGVRKRGEAMAAVAGLLACVVVGIQVPMVMNRITAGRLAEAEAREKTPGEAMAELAKTPLERVTIQWPAARAGRMACDELCQTLLYNEVAKSVEVRGELEGRKRQGGAKVYRIERERCVMEPETMKSLRDERGGQWTTGEKARAVARAVRRRIAAEECLAVEESGAGARGGAVMVRYVEELDGGAGKEMALRPGAVWMKGVEVSVGEKVLGRETVRGATPLEMPLHLEPISNGLGFRGWRWSRKREYVDEGKIDRMAMLGRLTRWDLEEPRGGGESTIRQRLDEALERKEEGNGAFALLGDYYEELRKEGFESGDRERLARLILDERVDDFSYFHWSEKQRENVGAGIRDAILRRLLAEQGREKKVVTGQLENLAGSLSAGTYAGETPWLDELLRDGRERRWYPNLVKRLGEQGPAGGEKLVRILEEAWGLPDKGFAWGRDAEAATEGLCRMGEGAREYLPRLRAVHARFGKVAFVRGHAWRGMLVAMGARPEEFELEGRRDGARYAEELRKAAEACAAKGRGKEEGEKGRERPRGRRGKV